MILIKEIEIVGNGKTINYYKDKGYDIKCNKKITIKIEDLIETSAIKLDCYCDICSSLNNIGYYTYIGNIKRNMFINLIYKNKNIMRYLRKFNENINNVREYIRTKIQKIRKYLKLA